MNGTEKNELYEKSFKFAIWIFSITTLFSVLYGGIYTEFYIEGVAVTPTNIVFAILGALLSGVIVGFHSFILAYIFNFLIKKWKDRHASNN